MRPFHVAVLECDTPVDAVKDSRGTYGDVFKTLLQAGLDKRNHDDGKEENDGGVKLRVSKWDVINSDAFPELDEVDGLLITGSKHTAWKDDAWIIRLVERVRNILNTTDKRVVGICFGHQIIGRALGAKVAVSPGGWEVSVDKVDLSQDGCQLFGVPSLSLHQMHKDAVLETPTGLANLGSSPSCAIQGFYKRRSVLSVQAHPEFDGFIMRAIMATRHGQGVFDDAMYEDGVARAGRTHDGGAVGAAIWRFWLGD